MTPKRWIAFLLGMAVCCAQAPIQLRVDGSDAARRLFHVRMTMPAKPGPMTLLYPEWIPGEHGPTGPIANLVGLKITAGSQTIPWTRDSVNVYAFHMTVPAGVQSLDVAFDFISPPETGGFSSGSSATTELAVLNWNQVLLYPQDAPADTLQYQASLRVPDAWRYGTALPIGRETGNDIQFQPASLTTMVDSPISMGRHFRTIDLGTVDGAPHFLHLAADSNEALAIPDELQQHYRNLVKEAGALFGSRHYRDYHFLVTLSDHVAHFGLEHHESSDDRIDERSLIDPGARAVEASLLPHEFTHSWNGKYRRPAGLVKGSADGGYDTPMQGDLLWVYEGLTNYLGEILAPRSGLLTPDEYREDLAITAAHLDNESGRTWRPLADTAIAAQVLYETSADYADYRRATDFYPEGTLIWLETDVMIRQLSKGAKSLNDFCRSFHGGPGGAPAMKTYTFDDVVAALQAVQPYDWAAFLNTRLHSTDAHAPLGGIQKSGWKLAYSAEPGEYWKKREAARKVIDLSYSLGFRVSQDGAVADVTYGGPAHKAGLSPSVKLVAVNSRQFTPEVLHDAIKAMKPVDLLIKNGEYYSTIHVNYQNGERYPKLERDSAMPDILSQIIAPLVK